MNDLKNDAREAVSQDAYVAGMRTVVQPVGLVTAAQGEQWDGLVAVTICSATMQPPTLVVCVKHEVSVARMIADTGCFAVSFLSEVQAPIARHFSDRSTTASTRFSAGAWCRSVTGAPLLQKSVSAFDCELVQVVRCGSHSLFMGRVVSTLTHGGDALLYGGGYFAAWHLLIKSNEGT